MTSSVRVKQVLAVVPAEAGGRAVGTALSSVFGSAAQVTVVETADEDKAALGQAQVILTGLGPVTADHILTLGAHRSDTVVAAISRWSQILLRRTNEG